MIDDAALAATVPTDWSDVTPEWMTAALQRDFPGVEVASVEVAGRDDGTNRRARLALSYAAGTGPDLVFVKGEGSWRESHSRNGNLWNEPELFASRLPLPVDHPRSYHVSVDRDALDYAIVMEDVTRRGADPRDATRPMTVAQAADGVRQLAALHSAYWDLAATGPGLEWLQTWEATPGWRQSLTPGLPIGTERATDILPPPVLDRASSDLLELAMRSMTTFATGPLTLLHADPHVGNTYVLPGDRVGFLDWQVCRRGGWAQDLAYFLVSALTVDDRRECERSMLATYLESLTVPEPGRPDPQEVWLRYSAAHAYGLVVWLATYSTDRSQRPEVSRALVERYAAAFVDGNSPAALDRLGA